MKFDYQITQVFGESLYEQEYDRLYPKVSHSHLQLKALGVS